MNKETKIVSNHIGNALIFMCRYSYPRQTSADMATVLALKALWELVPDIQKDIILDEMTSEIENKTIANDPFLWFDFLEWSEKQKKDS